MAHTIRRLISDNRGATAMEYGLIVALIGIVVLGAMGTLGDAISNRLYNNIMEALND